MELYLLYELVYRRKNMELKTVNIQENNNSCFVYVPKAWINSMKLKKGDKMVWNLDEGNHDILYLKKMSNVGDTHE